MKGWADLSPLAYTGLKKYFNDMEIFTDEVHENDKKCYYQTSVIKGTLEFSILWESQGSSFDASYRSFVGTLMFLKLPDLKAGLALS